ncbi:hypothetical protein, partial [Micromonospora sp. NPDC004704]
DGARRRREFRVSVKLDPFAGHAAPNPFRLALVGSAAGSVGARSVLGTWQTGWRDDLALVVGHKSG